MFEEGRLAAALGAVYDVDGERATLAKLSICVRALSLSTNSTSKPANEALILFTGLNPWQSLRGYPLAQRRPLGGFTTLLARPHRLQRRLPGAGLGAWRR